MILGAAFCPHPPALLPELAVNAAPELDDLRLACRAAIAELAELGAPLVLIGSGADSALHAPLCRGTFAGFGLDVEVHLGSPGGGGARDLPLSLTVGAWLVGNVAGDRSGSRAVSVGPDFDSSSAAAELHAITAAEDVSLLVMGDGSARRSTSAPGYLDERAAAYDASVRAALDSGKPAVLAALDADLGAQLLAAGVPAWHAAARYLAGATFDARCDYDAAPYGVGYFVARWLARG